MKFHALSDRYKGEVAKEYDATRRSASKWRNEQRVMRQLLRSLPAGSSVIDIPVGTGRFIEVYKESQLRATGMDISADMLKEARKKLAEHSFDMCLEVGDIRKVGAKDGMFDCAVCIRFLNWIRTQDVENVLCELSRVSRKHLIVGVRHYVSLGGLSPVYRPRNAIRLIGQLYKRLRWKRGLVFHRQTSIRGAFNSLRLKVVRAACIEERWDGTDYYIYHLTKEGA